MMRAELLPGVNLDRYDAALLDATGRMRARPASALHAMHLDTLRAWAVMRARYNLVTAELVTFLRDQIRAAGADPATNDVIEIAAGMGDLGHAVGVHMTDSAMQTTAEMRAYYASLHQPVIDPPPDVERIDAAEAVRRYRPRVVIAAWATQLYRDGDTPSRIGSSVYGVDEEWIVRNVEVYIHVGNDSPHAGKRIYGIDHEVVRAPWLVSRARDQVANCIRIWRKR